jgi:Family of unknown function (DUF5706)
MVTTFNEDCEALDHDWSNWWPEYCRDGHKHWVRVCARCLTDETDSCQEAALAAGTTTGVDQRGGRTVYESGAAFVARMDELMAGARDDTSATTGDPSSDDAAPAAPPVLLVVVHEQARDELRRVDTKATVLLSLVGVALVAVVALAGRPLPPVAAVVLWCAAVPAFAAAVLLLLAAVRPRVGRRVRPVPGTWLHAAVAADPADLLAACTRATAPVALAREVCNQAALAVGKYRRIGQAVTLVAVGLGLVLVALLLAAVLP